MNTRDCTPALSDFVIRHSFGFRHSSFVIFLRLIEQLVGAGTSVSANYCEADDGVSRKDFKNKIGTCRKRGTRNQVLPADCGHRRTEPETRGPDSLAGSQRIAPDLQPHLAQVIL